MSQYEDLDMPEIPVNTSTARFIYILYLISVFLPIVSIIGVVMAYVNKDDASEWLQSHYQFQIRTFWLSVLFLAIGSILVLILLGYLILLFWLFWIVIRCAKGMKSLDSYQAHPNPTSWMFG